MKASTYHIAESVIADTLAYEQDVRAYLAGEISPVAFRGRRVPMGIYEQREPDTYMVRIRGAAGVFLAHQARVVADAAGRFSFPRAELVEASKASVHVTTRQDLQIHGVRIEDTPTVLRELLEAGLSTRGGGGNTVRNISACPLAGVCPDESFDVTPHALALTGYLTSFRSSFNLPRKFKVAFSGCRKDCALCSVADLGFFAHVRDGARGFSVYAGGGMGQHSTLATRIEEFVAEEALFEVAEAVKRLFDLYGDRTDRRRARLRFVLERLGPDRFRGAYREQLQQVRREAPCFPAIPEPPDMPAAPPGEMVHEPADPEYAAWRRANVLDQKQPGLHSVRMPLPLGDIEPSTLARLADLSKTLGDGSLRTTQDQDLLLRGVARSKLPELYEELRSASRSLTRPTPVKCVACAGASTCKLGLCLSRGLAVAVEKRLRNIQLPPGTAIRVSGCPNACGQHPVAPVGLFGCASRVDGRLMPCYTVVAGGRMAEGEAVLAQAVGKAPAKAVPGLMREFWAAAAAARLPDEPLHDLMARWGTDCLRGLVEKHGAVPPYEDAPEFYRDFGSSDDFSLAGRGPGECGAGVTDVIALDIEQARSALTEGRLYEAVVAAARALLVTRGLEPRTDREVFAGFAEHLIGPRWVPSSARRLIDSAVDYRLGDRQTMDDLRDQISLLIDRVHALFASLDSNLNFRLEPVEDRDDAAQAEEHPACAELDLRGVACPMNFVRAKLHLEQLSAGEVAEFLLDDGEPARNVPASFAEQGQEVLTVTREDDHFRVAVRKTM